MCVNLPFCEISPTDRVMHASIVGVRSVLPMMVGFIPSFMLPGVVPAVVSAIFNGFA
jgi:hypothetical protein